MTVSNQRQPAASAAIKEALSLRVIRPVLSAHRGRARPAGRGRGRLPTHHPIRPVDAPPRRARPKCPGITPAGVQQDPEGRVCRVMRSRMDIGRVAVFQSYRRDEEVREGMEHVVRQSRELRILQLVLLRRALNAAASCSPRVFTDFRASQSRSSPSLNERKNLRRGSPTGGSQRRSWRSPLA